MFRCTVQCNHGTLAVPSTFLILQFGKFPSWQDEVNKTAMFWGLSVGFLIWAFKTGAGYSIQDEQGQPAPLDHEGSWYLLHLQPQKLSIDVESPSGVNDKATGTMKHHFSKPLLWVGSNNCLKRALWGVIFVDKSNYDSHVPLSKAESPYRKRNFNEPTAKWISNPRRFSSFKE